MPPFVIQQTKKEVVNLQPDMLAQVRDAPKDGDIDINGRMYRFLKPDDFARAMEKKELASSWALPIYPSNKCSDSSIPKLRNLVQDSEYQSL